MLWLCAWYQLAEAVFRSLRTSGNVLIPADTAGRALELALRLDLAWREANYSQYEAPGLFILSYTGSKTVRTFILLHLISHQCS